MNKTKRKVFYHIHKIGICDEKWQVGNVLEIKQNEFIKYSLNFSSYIDIYNRKKVPIKNAVEFAQKSDDISTQLFLLSKSKDIISEYQILVREIGFEEVRKSKFNNLPSRYNCIWLCRKDQIGYWIKQLNYQRYVIYKVEIYNEPFKSRNSLISLPNDSYIDVCEKAQKYWCYNNDKDYEDDEYLYGGKFKILDSKNSKF